MNLPARLSTILLAITLASSLFAGRTAAQAVCSLSALGDVTAYADPDKTQTAITLLPGDGGQVMGQLRDGTYGVALGRYNVESVPTESLRWIDYSADISLNGACDSLPPLSPVVGRLEAPDSGSRVEMTVGETILISLPGEARPGVQWTLKQACGANDPTVLAQQGEADFLASPDGLAVTTFTFMAVGAGKTTIDLAYAALDGQPSDAFAHAFTVEITVLPATTLEG